METTEFNRWVNDHNIDHNHPYAKGWWNHIEYIRLLAHHLGSDCQFVVGDLHVTTPPPSTPMILPVVRMEFGRDSATLAWFLPHAGFAPEYLVAFSGPCRIQPSAYRTFTSSPNEFQWVLEKLAQAPANRPLLPLFPVNAAQCVFACNNEMDLYGALKCLLENN